MTLHEEQEIVQKAVQHSLSHVQADPWLTQRVLAMQKGAEPVGKRKISVLVISVACALAMLGTAFALFNSQVAEFFSQYWSQQLGDRLKAGKTAQIGESVTVGDVVFTLNEVVYQDQSLWGVGTVRATNDRDVLVPMDYAYETPRSVIWQSEEAQALVARAKASGGRLLTTECAPSQVAVDGGISLKGGTVGMMDVLNEDGSLTFSFQMSDNPVLLDGQTFQLEMDSLVIELTEDGFLAPTKIQQLTWTVEFTPVLPSDAEPTTTPAAVDPDNVQADGYVVVAPAYYRETGTLPVYKAELNDFTKTASIDMFNHSGVATAKEDGHYTFNDHAELDIDETLIWYMEYTDELFDYSWREREAHNPNTEPDVRPRQAITFSIMQMAEALCDKKAYLAGQDLSLHENSLVSLTYAQACAQAEELLQRLHLNGFSLVEAMDMSVERIRSVGALYNSFWYEGEGYTNAPRQDFDTVTEAEEGYYLFYAPLGVQDIANGLHEASLYITSRGIAFAEIRSTFIRGDALSTPDRLLNPQEAVQRLYEEAAASPEHVSIGEVQRLELTYKVTHAENKADGMIFVPVWQIRFTSVTDSHPESSVWLDLNAVNGRMIDCSF